MLKNIRRIISGLNTKKKSSILIDESIEALTPYPIFPSFQLQNLFYTEENPQTIDTQHINTPYDIDLPIGAMRILKIRMPTKTEMIAEMIVAEQEPPDQWENFNIHRTNSIDYIYVLSGAITYVIGQQKTELKEGDFLVQISPEHTWINDHDKPCYILCIMIGIEKAGEIKKMSIG